MFVFAAFISLGVPLLHIDTSSDPFVVTLMLGACNVCFPTVFLFVSLLFGSSISACVDVCDVRMVVSSSLLHYLLDDARLQSV